MRRTHHSAASRRVEFDALPPHNIEAEGSVLGALILENDRIAACREILKPSDFFRDIHERLYAAIISLHNRHIPADTVTLDEEMRRVDPSLPAEQSLELFAAVMRVPSAANLMAHAQIVREKSRQRQLIDACNRASLESHIKPAAQVLKALENVAESLADEDADEAKTIEPNWPDPLAPAAWRGLAGELIQTISPHSESDPAALLVQFLVAFGNMIGRDASWRVENTIHRLNLFCAIVGNTSQARKGTGWDHVLWLMGQVDPTWTDTRVKRGLSTGEGMIKEVADPVIEKVKRKRSDDVYVWEEEEISPGEEDKRVLFVENELGATIAIMNREGNSLSGVLRCAWDGIPLGNMSKSKGLSSRQHHISMIGHITIEELRNRLTDVDLYNGFANRFLWVLARRVRQLPFGGEIRSVDFNYLLGALDAARAHGKREWINSIDFDPTARELWRSKYADLTEAMPGPFGVVTSRAAPQVRRLACIFAVLDRCNACSLPHLEAALAVWDYCRASAEYLFGGAQSDPITRAVQEIVIAAGPEGIGQSQLTIRLRRQAKAEEIGESLATLAKLGSLRSEVRTGSGRRAKIWIATRFQSDPPSEQESAPGPSEAPVPAF